MNVFVYGLLRHDINSPLSHVLEGHRWEYATLPNHEVVKERGHFTVKVNVKCSTFGVVYKGLSMADIEHLDAIESEGYFYERKATTVFGASGREYLAYYYEQIDFDWDDYVKSMRN